MHGTAELAKGSLQTELVRSAAMYLYCRAVIYIPASLQESYKANLGAGAALFQIQAL